MADILDEFDNKEINIFKNDFIQLMRVAKGMDKYYSKQDKKLDKYMPFYEKLIENFNKKYKNLQIKLIKTPSALRLRLFIKEKNVKDIFSSAAIKIIGLKSIGANGFGKADVTKSDELNKELEKIQNKIYISYYHQEKGSDTIILEYDKKAKMVELLYDPATIVNEASPEFKLVAFYAIKNFNPKIDIFTKGAVFGFVDILSEDEKMEWFGTFNPRIGE